MKTTTSPEETFFFTQAENSLNAMAIKTQEMKIKGVALIAYLEGLEKNSWISKMKVCGALKNEEANFLAIAYTKAGEMADTLQNSGTTDREPLLGEFNFLGGLIEKTKSGYLFAVFSGATGEEDTVVAQVGLNAYLDL